MIRRRAIKCLNPRCRLGPCRAAIRTLLADPSEVPLGCPNLGRRCLRESSIYSKLVCTGFSLTPCAAQIVAHRPGANGLAELAALIRAGRLVLLEPRVEHPVRLGTASTPKSPIIELGVDTLETTSWVKFKVVYDKTGEPVPGVALNIRLPNGSETELTTRADGMIEIDEIDPGLCEVSGSIEGARLDHALDFVSVGERIVLPDEAGVPTDDGGPQAANNRVEASYENAGSAKPRRIVRVEKHKVRPGETLESIALANGMAWEALTEFNWGTSVPREINEFLRDEVGCTRKTLDGHNYVFTSEDHPGIICLPKPWAQDGLATEETHTVRVKSERKFMIILENERLLRLPEVKYKATLADGSKRNGRLGRSGIARLDDPPVGEIKVEFQDYDDIKAKSIAACVRKAFDERDISELLHLIEQSPRIIRLAIQAYDEYFNDYTGNGLIDDIYQEITEPLLLSAIEGGLALASIEVRSQIECVQYGSVYVMRPSDSPTD